MTTPPSSPAFRVGFVTGATPDKWAGVWRERRREPLELVPVDQEHQEAGLRDGSLDMCLVRLPVDRDGLHLIPLYEEQPVVVVGKEHLVTAADEVALDDLSEEQLVLPHPSGWTPSVPQLDWPAMSAKDAVEVVASGTGVAIVPMSVARLYSRKDVTYRPVTDLPPTTVGLAWLVEHDDERTQAFVGVVRGRTARSSRG
ncbi:LysR family substrate-binding domain-containing protein [Nocardioides ferulae]|uniref:LysR family substrate-binding domain-containing protein n=1 Tax=Nocardioides ferulae TaxID=2340821 RepID=UPI000EAE12E5|nr:LysR family substrate-binding domain-containing protein [Nocardioides ferulae]